MRKQDKMIIWPAYFDVARTREKGRRVPRSLAVQSPRVVEVEEATRRLGLKPELRADVAYPKSPWSKGGMVLVEKRQPKEETINRIARLLPKIRNELQAAPKK
jgi:signal recognition particle subunit SRP19